MYVTTHHDDFGRFAEVPVADMPPDMKQAYDHTTSLRGMVSGPHNIWLAPTLPVSTSKGSC